MRQACRWRQGCSYPENGHASAAPPPPPWQARSCRTSRPGRIRTAVASRNCPSQSGVCHNSLHQPMMEGRQPRCPPISTNRKPAGSAPRPARSAAQAAARLRTAWAFGRVRGGGVGHRAGRVARRNVSARDPIPRWRRGPAHRPARARRLKVRHCDAPGPRCMADALFNPRQCNFRSS